MKNFHTPIVNVLYSESVLNSDQRQKLMFIQLVSFKSIQSKMTISPVDKIFQRY